jgi:hypothetical protein
MACSTLGPWAVTPEPCARFCQRRVQRELLTQDALECARSGKAQQLLERLEGCDAVAIGEPSIDEEARNRERGERSRERLRAATCVAEPRHSLFEQWRCDVHALAVAF